MTEAAAQPLPVPTADGPVVLARAAWPEAGDERPTPIPGFVLSEFSPLVAEVAERCLAARYGRPPATGGETALVLASTSGDTTTNEVAATAAAAGHRAPPLLFFQSNPNAVLGWIAARWQLTGPVLSIAPCGDAFAGGVAEAERLLEDGEAAEVLVVAADLEPLRAEAALLGQAAAMTLIVPAPVADLPASELVEPEPLPATALLVPEPPAAAAAELIVLEEPR